MLVRSKGELVLVPSYVRSTVTYQQRLAYFSAKEGPAIPPTHTGHLQCLCPRKTPHSAKTKRRNKHMLQSSPGQFNAVQYSVGIETPEARIHKVRSSNARTCQTQTRPGQDKQGQASAATRSIPSSCREGAYSHSPIYSLAHPHSPALTQPKPQSQPPGFASGASEPENKPRREKVRPVP